MLQVLQDHMPPAGKGRLGTADLPDLCKGQTISDAKLLTVDGPEHSVAAATPANGHTDNGHIAAGISSRIRAADEPDWPGNVPFSNDVQQETANGNDTCREEPQPGGRHAAAEDNDEASGSGRTTGNHCIGQHLPHSAESCIDQV